MKSDHLSLKDFLCSALIPVEIEKDLKVSVVNSPWTPCACLCEEIDGNKVLSSKVKERQIYMFQEQLIELEEEDKDLENEENDHSVQSDNESVASETPEENSTDIPLRSVLIAAFTTYEYYNELDNPNYNNIFVCVDKVDTTGAVQDTKTSVIRQLIRAYLDYIRYAFSADQILCYVFARAQPQYLFVNSSDYPAKRPLTDAQLCKWWKKTLSQSVCKVDDITSESSHTDRWEGLWLIPGFQPIECRNIEGNLVHSEVKWKWGIPYPMDASSERVIPILPDDCKSRMIYDHDSLSVKALFEMIAIGEECGSGKRTGMFFLKKDTKLPKLSLSSPDDGNCSQEEFTQLLELLLEQSQFDDLYNIVESSARIFQWLVDHQISANSSEIHPKIDSVIPNPEEAAAIATTSLNIKRKADNQVNELSSTLIKRKTEATENELSPSLIKRKPASESQSTVQNNDDSNTKTVNVLDPSLIRRNK